MSRNHKESRHLKVSNLECFLDLASSVAGYGRCQGLWGGSTARLDWSLRISTIAVGLPYSILDVRNLSSRSGIW